MEGIAKVYELRQLRDVDELDELFDEVAKLLEDNNVLLNEIQETEHPIAGSFALGNEDGSFAKLDTMDGKELKVSARICFHNSCQCVDF